MLPTIIHSRSQEWWLLCDLYITHPNRWEKNSIARDNNNTTNIPNCDTQICYALCHVLVYLYNILGWSSFSFIHLVIHPVIHSSIQVPHPGRRRWWGLHSVQRSRVPTSCSIYIHMCNIYYIYNVYFLSLYLIYNIELMYFLVSNLLSLFEFLFSPHPFFFFFFFFFLWWVWRVHNLGIQETQIVHNWFPPPPL